MEYIASGFYYHVYKISPTRVRKVPTSWIRKAWLLIWWQMVPLKNIIEEIKDITNWKENEYAKTRSLIQTFTKQELLGNPTLPDTNGSYEQDYAPKMESTLKEMSEEDFEKYVLNYIEIQKLLWKHEFNEKIWNFTFNCGIKPDKNLILIDLNEVTRKKEIVVEHINKRKWLERNTMTTLKEKFPNLYQIASEIMDRECTIGELEKNWGKITSQNSSSDL